MSEIILLKFILLAAYLLAPLMTKKFFLSNSRFYSDAHKLSLLLLIIGASFNVNHLVLIWPLFCVSGVFLYIKNSKFVFTAQYLAGFIPFAFSLISSVWFLSATYDLHLLGYDKIWSFYAAIHGSFIGWLFVGCLVFLSRRKNASKIYLCGCYLSFLLFLCVAFGIDGVPYIKRVGVIGLALLVPFYIGHYFFNLKRESRLSIIFSSLSALSITLSMSLALLYEFWVDFPREVSGMPIMVVTHGFLNAIIAIPCFFLAICNDNKESVEKFKLNENTILFDGHCVLCNGTVSLLIKLDKKRRIKYSSLQGTFAKTALNRVDSNSSDSVIFCSEGKFFEKGEAVIQIALKLGGIYKFIGLTLTILPIFILDIFYDLIARNRYRVFGKKDVCMIPTDDVKELFIP